MKKLFINLKEKSGMTLVEVLTAMTILALMIFCFAPLFLSYLQTINISGATLQKAYDKAGVMQRLIGNKQTGENTGYEVGVSSIPLTLNAPNTTITRGTGAETRTATVNGVSLTMGNQLDNMIGGAINTNPDDPFSGFTTVYGTFNSSIKCFPSSLTDDFKEAYITLVADGFSFGSNAMNSSTYQLFCTVADSSNTGTSLKKLQFGVDYTIRKSSDSDQILIITLYGGTDVNFENSPLVFNYNQGAYVKEIEIDAPQMIMVGEQGSDGKYYYYVSRGELDEKGNLIVLRREMKSKDAKDNNSTVSLTSAMNDVEWVDADGGDGNNTYTDKYGKESKYGYYVMCGDNGQIRRFWKNPATGNYYWGGDYTYYTDINLNRVEGENYYTLDGTNDDGKGRTYDTSVSYKFLARRGTPGNEGTDGYQLVHGTTSSLNKTPRDNDAMAVTQNMWTVTALDGTNSGEHAYFYGTDGKILYYYMDEKMKDGGFSNGLQASQVGDGSFDALRDNIFGKTSYNGRKFRGTGSYDQWNFEALSWLNPDTESYYKLNGINKSSVNTNSYPITLTCVDGIVLTGSGAAYANHKTTDYNYDVSDGHATMSPYLENYPTSSYTLYCGYIPSAYDVWSRKAYAGASLEIASNKTNADQLVAKETFDYYHETSAVDSNLDRRSTDILEGSTEKNPLWRGTFGITPYYTSGNSLVIRNNATGVYRGRKTAYDAASFGNRSWLDYMWYWPYTNLDYAVSGKFYDSSTPASEYEHLFKLTTDSSLLENRLYSIRGVKSGDVRQRYLTSGKVMDITCSYFSEPFAIHIAANPSVDTKAFMLGNDKENSSAWSYYYANRRETVTILNVASTLIPNSEQDIPVSLAVGYAQGGSVTFSETKSGLTTTYPAFVNNIMPLGIVYLRAGEAEIGKQAANGMATGEYQTVDKNGYQLSSESNYFHQFYYLNSKLDQNTKNAAGPGRNSGGDEYTLAGAITGIEAHIGNMYGAWYWPNNRHIVFRSADGGQPTSNTQCQNTNGDGNYNYVRCHPLVDTKVTCVDWGTTWNSNPEAMWGTENGTVLSWWVNMQDAQNSSNQSKYNDKSVAAEFQGYQWIDNVDNNYFSVTGKATGSGSNYKETVGAHLGSKNNYTVQKFTRYNTGAINEAFSYFFDKSTQALGLWQKGYGFVSTLDGINDIEYANDIWVAVGNQSGKDPAEYCGGAPTDDGKYAFSDNGRGGSWVNVRYWWDKAGTGIQDESNSNYLWKAVKISNNSKFNIVQINNLNGVWFATGYEDSNGDGEWSTGERAIVCWTSNPLASCNEEGGWSMDTQFYANSGNGYQKISEYTVGGINSVATRS